MRQPCLLAAALAIAALAATAVRAEPAALTEAAVRAFVQRQDRTWNAGDLAGFFATYAPGAVFVSQAQNSQGGTTPFGRSTVPEARAQARRASARARALQQTVVERVVIAPGGRSALVHARQTTRQVIDGRLRILCGQTDQTLALTGGRIRSHGETDTAERCRR